MQVKSLAFIISGFFMMAFPPAWAQTAANTTAMAPSDGAQAMQAFSNDPSKPDASIELTLPQVNTTPVSAQTRSAWATYNAPIRQCIAGNIIVPSNGSDVFSFLFGNNAQVQINMAIQGWKQDRCQIQLTEGTNALNCNFNHTDLISFMDAVLDPTGFNTNSGFAQRLHQLCQMPMASNNM